MGPGRLTRRALVLSLLLLPALARSQGTGRSMDFDVSIRSAAMGGASNPVFWGEDLNHWANPALLAYARGLRYEQGSTQLVPGLASDVTFKSGLLKAGFGGMGVVYSRSPTLKGVRLSYGTSQGTDPVGNPTVTFESHEQVDSWGFGVSLLEATETVSGWLGHPTRHFSRYGDVSFGMNFKDVEVALAPAALSGVGATTARDWGVVVRATPFDGLEGRSPVPIRLDLAFGKSVLSYNDDAVIHFVNEDVVARVSRHQRSGFAGRVAMTPPGLDAKAAPNTVAAALLSGLLPLISFGIATDEARIDAGAGISEYSTDGGGRELTVANVFFWRHGHYADRLGSVDGETTGWGLGIPLGPWAGVRWDRAEFPQSSDSGLPDMTREGFSAWVDLYAIWGSTHR